MRSRSAKPVSCTTTLTECRPSSIMNLAASSRSRSTALAGDWPVSARQNRRDRLGRSLSRDRAEGAGMPCWQEIIQRR
jgi:hypothetical protein